MSASATHRVRIRKIKALLTQYQCECSCGWESPLTTKVKAQIGKQVHEGGGIVVSWSKAKPSYEACPECLSRQILAEQGDDLSTLPDVCPTCEGAGKVQAETVH